jgi:hypothetical protein
LAILKGILRKAASGSTWLVTSPRLTDNLTPLILDLLEWLATQPRTYADVMEAWRTSCPRLAVWEEVNNRGLVVQRYVDGQGVLIEPTPEGRSLLKQSGRSKTDV